VSEVITPKANGVRLAVRVQPRAAADRIQRTPEGAIRVWLTAPPVDNKANAALCMLLANRIGCPKSAVTVIHGDKARDKCVEIVGVEPADVDRAIAAHGK